MTDLNARRLNFRKFLALIRAYRLHPNLKNSILQSKRQISFLGRIAGRNGVRPDIERIINWPVAVDVKITRNVGQIWSLYKY